MFHITLSPLPPAPLRLFARIHKSRNIRRMGAHRIICLLAGLGRRRIPAGRSRTCPNRSGRLLQRLQALHQILYLGHSRRIGRGRISRLHPGGCIRAGSSRFLRCWGSRCGFFAICRRIGGSRRARTARYNSVYGFVGLGNLLLKSFRGYRFGTDALRLHSFIPFALAGAVQ